MPESKAYELPSKEKYPELYKKTVGLFKKDTAKFADAIINYAKEDLQPYETAGIYGFIERQGHENLKPNKIKEELPYSCGAGYIREAEFVLTLQGQKIEKEDILISNEGYSVIYKTAIEDRNQLLWLGETMHDAGTPITKKDMIEPKVFYKTSYKDGKKKENEGLVIAGAAINGNLDQVKAIVEMNNEKLTKDDLMFDVSDEAGEHRRNSIAFVALKTGQFDIVEQILTEEGTFLSVDDVMYDFKNIDQNKHYSGKSRQSIAEEKKCLGRLLTSPVFKDTSENITKMWKELPDEFKTSAENQKTYQTALKNIKSHDIKKEKEEKKSQARAAAKALNKAGITALKAKIKEQR
ncbi:MAG: hypothetical protein KAJ75_07795 [Alphaproteobacteria bacterium]|nr:hypothetical protein [Alphaproteobacteria bacterium]